MLGADDLAVGYKVLKWAEQEGLLSRILAQARPKFPVIVLGTSGAGKSNFLSSLVNPIVRSIPADDRTQFTRRRLMTMPGQSKQFLFYDTPGQALHQARRNESIRAVLGRKRFGVINVVANGFIEVGSISESQALQPDGLPNETYLKAQRKVEINAAAEWLPLLAQETDFLITLVSKADLWWPDRAAVMAEYEAGKYGGAIQALGVKKHAVLPYASVIHRFFGSRVSGLFDLDDMITLRTQFQEQLLAATER